MAGVAVTSLLEKLWRLRTHHAHLISDIHEEVELLQIDLFVLKNFLLEHDDGEDEAWALREMKREIQECVYEVEASIDTNLTQNEGWRTKIIKTREEELMLFSEQAVFRRIGELNEVIGKRFPASSKVKPLLKTGNPEGISGARALMTTLPPIQQIDNVMGRDDDEKKIISHLMESSEVLRVISIVGPSGVGKTTLARRIYVNTKIANEFPVRFWICVSSNSKLDDILRNILRVFTSQDIDSLSHEELSENVLACLEKKKFLLVLKDIRKLSHWTPIYNFLYKGNIVMGKILITTCFDEVGEYCSSKMKRSLKPLGIMDSWKFLQLKVFGDLKRCPGELEVIGRTIADKCEGIPLQIILVGGILMRQLVKSNIQNPNKDVLEVYENVNKDLHKGVNPSGVAALAYSRLSDELSQCFLYMGVFPEDYEISAWTLTRLWIAEGLVRPMEGHSLEEAATHNLDDLIRMGLVMVDKMNPFGKIKTCRVHAIIYGYIMKKSAREEVFQLLSAWFYRVPLCHRLCVHSNMNPDNLSRALKSSGLRSVLCFDESYTGSVPKDMSSILNSIVDVRLLKVLHTQSVKFHKLPQQITKLSLLRYVTLCIDILNTLPESLSELWNLETLVVDTKSRVITMEANIWRLIWLRHLKTNAAIILPSYNEDLSSNIGEDQSLAGENDLQTLTRLLPESCTTDVSERARNLKILGIRGDLEILFGKMFLERFDLLEKLKLIHDVFPKMSSENPLHQLPPPNHFPPNLKWLTLSQTHLVWDIDMPKLAKIKTLEVLKLKDDAFSGVIWRGPTGDCFPSLKFFLIENSNLVLWKPPPTKSSLPSLTCLVPSLTCLVLKNCENLIEIPEAVAEKLERLEIEHLGKSAVDSARRIADRKQQAQEKENVDCPFKLYIGAGCY